MMKKITFILITIVLLSSPAGAGAWDLTDTLKSYLREHYPWSEIEVKDLRLSAAAPAGPPSSIVVEQSPPGRTVLTLGYAGGQKITATATVKAFEPVVLCRRPLNKGSVFQKGDVYTTLADHGRIPKGAVRNEEEILGKVLSRGIGTNVVITDVMVTQTAEVKKGQKVLLLVDAPGFTIRAAGELLQGGFVGSYVKVISAQSNKTITGLLVDEHTVKVGL